MSDSGSGSNSNRFGMQGPDSSTSPLNSAEYLTDLIVNRRMHAVLVKVQAVTNKPGELKKPGRVDVLLLVNQTDGQGQATEHATAYDLCYFRLQGGKNAVLCDPEVGDIGLAVVCDRDISSVKATEDKANPGSLRRGNVADGIYFGVPLGPVPDQYVRFFEESGKRGIEVHDKNGNYALMNDDGVRVHDKNGNDILMSSTGIRIADKNTNRIVMDSSGINLNP